MVTQPTFWLQVRSEYIYDNFDALINYLRNYQYQPDEGNIEYNNTLACMTKMSEDYTTQSLSTPFYQNISFSRPTEDIVKVMCATILAAHKAGQTLHTVISGLIDLLLKTQARCPADIYFNLIRVLIHCIQGKKLVTPGFSWRDLDTISTSFELLTTRLSQMIFKGVDNSAKDEWCYYDNSGLLTVSPQGEMHIAAMNLKQYNDALMRDDISEFIELPSMLTVSTEKDTYKKCSDFDRLYETTERLIRQLNNIKPAVPSKKKEYGKDDEFIVKVIKKMDLKIEAETIDPSYETLHGNVFLSVTDSRPNWYVLKDTITEGSYLLVKRLYDNKCTFAIQESLEMDYRHYAADFANKYVDGIYIKDYNGGKEFVSNEGFHFGLADEKIEELTTEERADLDYCCSEGLPVPVRMYRDAPDTDGLHFNMYAEVDTDSLASAADISKSTKRFTAKEAETNMIKYFMKCWEEEATKLQRAIADFKPVLPELFVPILTTMYRISEHSLPSCRLRLEASTAMAMIAKIMKRESESDYIKYDRTFLIQEVNFAHGGTITPLPLNAELDEVTAIQQKREIIKILSEYRRPSPTKNSALPRVVNMLDETVDTNKTKALVEASNNLIRILDNAQLDGIKQYICRSLDIEDEYVSIRDSRTFYGVESISLEFKSSVVFPPSDRRRYTSAVADPELQKWAILKAVCGFLNSRAGGELLIGVKDTGYACGIADDVRELSRLGKIAAPSYDFYRTYVQNMIDYSFAVDNKEVASKDVTRFYVDSALEENEEGITILRVRIKPYPDGIVKFAAPDSDRPEDVEGSYVRQSGRTIPLTPELKNTIIYYKKYRHK